MTISDALYLASILQFIAVPAGALEFVRPDRLQEIEASLEKRLPQLGRTFGWLLVFVYVTMLLLVTTGPYLVLVVVFFNRAIAGALVLLGSEESVLARAAAATAVLAILGILSLLAAILQLWLLPESWLLGIARPYEVFSQWANSFQVTDWLLPDYSARGFLDTFQRTSADLDTWLRSWLWDWLAILYTPYFFLARGAVLVAVVVIQLSLGAGLIMAACLSVTVPLQLFMHASGFMKRKLNISEGRLPLGGFALYALGECLGFGLESYCRIASISCS